MSDVPNLKYLVEQIYAAGKYDLSTEHGQDVFTRTVARKLHDEDPNFGELLKSPGRTHAVDSLGRRVARDAVLYKPTGQAVDVIFMASPPSDKSRPSWSVDIPRYHASDWAKPAGKPTWEDEKPVEEPPTYPQEGPQDAPGSTPLLEVRVAVLEAELDALKAANKLLEDNIRMFAGEVVAEFYKHAERIQRLENQKLTLKAKGTTSRAWGHAHNVEIVLEEVK